MTSVVVIQRWMRSIGWILLAGEHRITSRQTRPTASLSTTNFTRTDAGWRVRDERQVT